MRNVPALEDDAFDELNCSVQGVELLFLLDFGIGGHDFIESDFVLHCKMSGITAPIFLILCEFY